MKSEYFSQTTHLIYIILLVKITSAGDISSLRVVCDIHDGFGSVQLDNLPPGCTAAATSANNISTINVMTNHTRTVPFILYFNKFDYVEWGDRLNNADDFVTFMDIEQIDGIIFNNMYQVNGEEDDIPEYDDRRNEVMYYFFSRLKELNPDRMYGLALPGHDEILAGAFNYELLDPVIDFYVIKTISFRECEFEITMSRTSTVGDMQKVLDSMNETVSMSKVLLTSQLYAEGITAHADNGPVLLSYSDLCGGKPLSRYRKYCKDSLETMWEKASLRSTYEMFGVYVQYVDCDDYRGLCHCHNSEGTYKFPGLAAIIAGSNNVNRSMFRCENSNDV